MTFLLLFVAAALVNGVIGAELRIKSVDGFIQFKDNVSSGTNYSGTTVFLDSDLDFTGKSFEQIGNSYNHFNGVFDGQGHVISNLKMNSSSSEYVGLFCYSGGLTIKNVILDSSCSITSSFSSNHVYIGGIVGWCFANDGPCTIESIVSMGSVVFNGNVSGYFLHLGGIAGDLRSTTNFDVTVKNCANYGDITHSGESSYSCFGGVVGQSSGFSTSTKRVYIYNTLNHGTITHNGTTSINLYLGGIAGFTECTTIENRVNGGRFSLLTNTTNCSYIGSIIGEVYTNVTINYTYFTSDLSDYNKYGLILSTPSESNVISYDSTSFELSGTVSIGSYTGISLVGALNAYSDYYKDSNYSQWLLNKGKNGVTFNIKGKSSFTLNTRVILLPSLASEGNKKFWWFTDDGLTTPLTAYEVTSETRLYGSFCNLPNYTVALDVNGDDELEYRQNVFVCDDTYLALPTPTRTEATFDGWFTEKTGGDKIESGNKVTILSDHTLYAHWSINNYTLTFIFGNWTEPEVRVLEYKETIAYPADPVRAGYSFAEWDSEITNMPADNTNITALWTPNNYTVTFKPNGGSVSQSTKVVTFGSAYGELPNSTKKGHTFLGWFTEKNESITGESIVKIPDNHTLYAHWLEITQSQVEIVFSTKDMGKKGIEEVIKKYTDADFTIAVIESGDTDEVRVIIEFVDEEKAEEFVEIIEASSEAKALIKRVGFIHILTPSFSTTHLPMSLLCLI